jgi:S1-C subfamily serine protease
MNKNILLITILAVIAGLAGGFLGGVINDNYFPQNIYDYPFLINSDFSETGINKSDFVIEGAEELIVEQNEQISKSVKGAKQSLVSIFEYKKINDKENNGGFSTSTLISAINNGRFYALNNKTAEGIILTDDGWIMTNNISMDTPQQIKENYRVLFMEDKLFEIDEVIEEERKGVLFLHLKEAKDLPAIELAEGKEVNVGNLVFASDGKQKALVTNIVEKTRENKTVQFSDQINVNLQLRDNPDDFFDRNAFVFNLDKQIVGVQVEPGRIIPIEQLRSDIQSLLEFNKIRKSEFGAYYIDLASIKMSENYPTRGALIYPNDKGISLVPDGSAEKAGLKEGDIILSVNNQKIDENNDLAHIIQNYLPGDELSINYARGEEEYRANIILE